MRIGRGETAHRSVERLEGVFRDDGGDFAAETSRQPVLVYDQHFAGLARGGQDSVAVERQQRAQIEHLDREPVFLFDDARASSD